MTLLLKILQIYINLLQKKEIYGKLLNRGILQKLRKENFLWICKKKRKNY